MQKTPLEKAQYVYGKIVEMNATFSPSNPDIGVISTAAAIVGDTALFLSSDFDDNSNTFFAGFTLEENIAGNILYGNTPYNPPQDSMIAIFNGMASKNAQYFPKLTDVLSFQERMKNKCTEGAVAVDLPTELYPPFSPIQSAYLMREIVHKNMDNLKYDVPFLLHFALYDNKKDINSNCAFRLAYDVMVGVSRKTPLTNGNIGYINTKKRISRKSVLPSPNIQ